MIRALCASPSRSFVANRTECAPTGDAQWLFGALSASPMRRDVKISRGTHLMHLEASRYALYRETEAFLSAGDLAPSAA